MYTPNPLDTSNVSLSSDVSAMSEVLAKNTHEAWAAGRIAQWWTYGNVRDDANKKHPCLIPYDDLPELEKEYDRATAMETLKAIIKFGFAIEKVY